VRGPPLIVAISTGGASPMLGRMLKARLESAIPAAYGRLAAFMGRARARVAAALATTRARRRFWERVLEGPIAEMALAGDEPAAEAALRRELDRAARGEESAPQGEVYLVGAGPGDPDLVTFRALRLMQKADVVLYDRLIGDGVLDLVRREAERIYVGKRRDDHPAPQEEISELLVRLARQGKRVLRLKGGDPFIFGRGGEEIEKLAEQGIPFQVCPGITAAAACSAFSGIPLTHRDHAQACLFVAGHGKDGPADLDWGALMRPNQTVAVYMGLAHIEELTRAFVARGVDPDLPAAAIDNGARVNQRVVVGTVATIAARARAAALRGPAIIIVGSVVTLRGKLDWRAPAGEASAAAAAPFMLANSAGELDADDEDG
jgi:uroporphyrin-III C-methyltransferase/precorrin-2 dehydrogenase/sirohydrochlorin ferrochelatase